MSLGTDDSRPPYIQLTELLKGRIVSGEFPPGAKLPPTRELADHYGVAPNTLLSAIRILREEGILSSQQGRGTFVRRLPEKSNEPPTPEFKQIMGQLEQFQTDLKAMSQRLEQLEELTAQLIAPTEQPTP